MSDILIRDLDPDTVAKLKARAKRNDRSLQAELRIILREASAAPAAITFEEAVRFADEMKRKLSGRIQDDSTDLIRSMRDSR